MNTSTRKLLNNADQELILETEKKNLDTLDEDELIALHTRVRRARNKYSKLYRRQASAQVVSDSARGAASKKNQRSAAKAEVFEEALARVSRRLSIVARASADELREARLAAARGDKAAAKRAKGANASKGAKTPAGGSKSAKGANARSASQARARRGDSALRSPSSKRATASTRASGKRKQAKRDSR